MKRFLCILLSAACALSVMALPVSAASLSPMQQMQILCEYQALVANMEGSYSTYGYFDFDNDGVQELILRPGASEAESYYDIYGWKNGGVQYITFFSAGHSSLYTPYGEHRLIKRFGHMGHEVISEVTLRGGSVQLKTLKERTLGKYDDYTALACPLEMYPKNYFVFPDSDHLTAMQDRYVDQMFLIGADECYLFPDMTGGGYPDIIACSATFPDTTRYTLYENKSGTFVEEGGFSHSFMAYAYPRSGKGILALDQGEGVWRLFISNGQFRCEPITGAWSSLIKSQPSICSMNTVQWFAPLYSRPDEPRNVNAQALSSTSVRLTWSESYRTNRSDVYLLNDQTGEYEYYTTVTGAFSYTATGLTPGKNYSFRIKSVEYDDGNYDAYMPYSAYSLSSAFSPVATVKTKDAPVPQYLRGDVSRDGSLTAEDARLALRAAVGLESYAPGSTEYLAADANVDGAITAEDARLILRAAVGLETLA